MPDELWNEVCDIVQETGIKTISMEKKCKKAKWLSGEALQIAEKRREVKGKGEKERYRVPKNSKKRALSEQCKEIEENNRMAKSGDLIKKTGYQKNISCKDGYNKGQKQRGPNRRD